MGHQAGFDSIPHAFNVSHCVATVYVTTSPISSITCWQTTSSLCSLHMYNGMALAPSLQILPPSVMRRTPVTFPPSIKSENRLKETTPLPSCGLRYMTSSFACLTRRQQNDLDTSLRGAHYIAYVLLAAFHTLMTSAHQRALSPESIPCQPCQHILCCNHIDDCGTESDQFALQHSTNHLCLAMAVTSSSFYLHRCCSHVHWTRRSTSSR